MRYRSQESKGPHDLKILVIGSLPPAMGGTAVLLQHLTRSLSERKDVQVLIINTSSVRSNKGVETFTVNSRPSSSNTPMKKISKLMRLAVNIFLESKNADIVTLHVNTTSIHSIGLYCWLVTRLRGKKLVIRKFAGTSLDYFGRVRSRLVKWVVAHCDLYLAETIFLVEEARKLGVKHVKWFANNRPMDEAGAATGVKESCNKFVFLGLVGRHKGIVELIEAAEKLDGDSHIDVFGPLIGDVNESFFTGKARIQYCGILESDNVHETLLTYDALVLPTFHNGEGYPGVIIEAYNAGIPVIATRWHSIPEIVEETSGVLVEPKNVDDLFRAMKKLSDDKEFYTKLCSGAVAMKKKFDSDVWNERFVNWCRELAGPIEPDRLESIDKESVG